MDINLQKFPLKELGWNGKNRKKKSKKIGKIWEKEAIEFSKTQWSKIKIGLNSVKLGKTR